MNHGNFYLNAPLWRMLTALEQEPRLLSALPRSSSMRDRRIGTARRAVDLGYVLGDMDADDPWLMLSASGRAALARVRALPKLPLYAGGTEPLYRRAPKVQVEGGVSDDNPVATPLMLPAPTTATQGDCTVSLTVRLEVSVDALLCEFRDAQSVAQAVANKLLSDNAAIAAALRGWRINGVMQGDKLITAEG